MSAVRPLRKFCIAWVTTIVLACLSNAVAQTGYKVTDLGTLGNAVPGQQDKIGALLNGRDAIDINGFQIDLGTLGGRNSFMNWGEINDFGQIVGYSETDVLDPNGEDIRGFGTHLTCRPFLWQNFHMSALPTLAEITGRPARSMTADKS